MPTSAAKPSRKFADKPSESWLKTLIIYPTLATSVLAALPTYGNLISAAVSGYKPGLVSVDATQNDLWKKNKDCLITAKPVSVTSPQGFQLTATVCATGDVLLDGKRVDSGFQNLKWVALSEVLPPPNAKVEYRSLFNIIPDAMASERHSSLLAQDGHIICQKWVANGRLLQRISATTGCFDKIINTFDGTVVSSQPAPCSPQC